MRYVLLIGIALVCVGAWAEDVMTCDFAKAPDVPWLKLEGDAQVADGVLKTSPRPGWLRSGLFVGPLPLEGGKWIVEYDVKPVAYGAQCQEFVSESPSTHWYMCYQSATGNMNLHTKGAGGWQGRGSSPMRLELGKWYHVTVALTAKSIRYVIARRDANKPLWDTGEVAMDDLGRETVFGLVDEASDAVGKTEWANLKVSTGDAALAAGMSRRIKELEAERREQERRQIAARKLREAGVALIPPPQEIALGEGSFTLAATTVIIPDPNKPDARADAEAVRGVIQERLGLGVQVGAGGSGTAIILTSKPLTDATPWHNAQGYRLSVEKTGVTIEASSPAGFFYAAQTLCQLADTERKGEAAQSGERAIPLCRITDWPAIESRLVMIALSQGAWQVIDTEYWKRMIRELAAAKINFIMPYDDGGTFVFEKYPFLALKGKDGFTREKARLLSDYAKEHFINLVPQQEMLGHSGDVLCHEELKDLRESGDVFCSSNPRTFQFLGDLFDELIQMFPYAEYIHVGGDEFAQGFAKCPLCKKRAEEIGKPGLYAEHMMKLHDMLKQRNRKMMIWWHEEGYTDQAADKLAKDIVVFDWHYGNQSSYPTLEKLQQEGFAETWATPAVTRYYDARDDWDNTFGNISGFMRAAAAQKVPGECTCTWVHGIWGGRNLFELNLYGVVFSGECAWNPLAVDYADFRWKFARRWFGLTGADLEQQVSQAIHTPFGEGKEQKFWSDNRALEETLGVPLSKTAEEIQKRPAIVDEAKDLAAFCKRDAEVLDRWQATATRNKVSAEFFAHDVHVHATTAERILAVKSLLDAYERAKPLGAVERREELRPEIERLRALAGEYKQIETMFERSILEAGGGKCGTGGWYPYVAGGGILFRAPQGRADIEKQADHLTQLLFADKLPEKVFGP